MNKILPGRGIIMTVAAFLLAPALYCQIAPPADYSPGGFSDPGSLFRQGGSSAATPVSNFNVDQFKILLKSLFPTNYNIWADERGGGLNRETQSLSLELGANSGVAIFGGQQKHDLALSSLCYGYVLTDTVAKDHWYRGNWEMRAELFGGSEFSPDFNWVIGLTPHLRYDFATGTKWIPFIDGGAGITGTGIGRPDLSGTFEFNVQIGGGVHRFLRDDLALTIELKYLHLSCAGLSSPNLGLNGVTGMIGMTRFF